MRKMSAAARAEWLAELVAALDAARSTVERLPVHSARRGEQTELLGRIDAARDEARAMQLRQKNRLERQSGPEWIDFSAERWPGKGPAQTPAGKSPPSEKGSR